MFGLPSVLYRKFHVIERIVAQLDVRFQLIDSMTCCTIILCCMPKKMVICFYVLTFFYVLSAVRHLVRGQIKSNVKL